MLVFGAGGYVGSNLVPALAGRGHRVRAAAPDRELLAARTWQDVELIAADALDPASLPAALAGVDVAYYLVPALALDRRRGGRDLVAADNFARAAADAGVRRIVYLGALVPMRADRGRLAWRRKVGERLRAGSVPVTEIRASIIVGPGSAAYEIVRDLVHNLPVMLTPRWVQSKASPIALANLIEYLVRVPDLDETADRVLDAGGADYLSYEAMLRTFADVAGRTPRILRIPVVSPRLSAYWLGLVTSVPARIARDLIAGLRQDIPAENDALRQLVPQRLLGFRDAVVAALDAERRNAVAARWTEGVLMARGDHRNYELFAKRASGAAVTRASPQAVWRVVTSLGGDNRYFFFDWIWTLREAADWLVGGPGFTRGRRDPHDLRLGDTIDYWTVIGLDPPRRLTLDFGLLAHGAGVLDFRIEPLEGGRTRLVETAYWHPRGIWGLLYWAALVPFHLFIFRGMTRAIVRRAERLTGDSVRGRS